MIDEQQNNRLNNIAKHLYDAWREGKETVLVKHIWRKEVEMLIDEGFLDMSIGMYGGTDERFVVHLRNEPEQKIIPSMNWETTPERIEEEKKKLNVKPNKKK